MRFRSVAPLVLVALIAGAIAAHADSSASPRRARTPARVVSAPARPFVAGTPLAIACAVPVPVAPGRRPSQPTQPTRPPKAATAAPPSQQLLDAFAILRRPRSAQDALSPEALEALRVRGLSPVSLDSSRLLRSTASSGKAWVVPVPNVVRRLGVACGPVRTSGPREGLVVVAVGDAASGGGGALDDLVRGRAPVTVAPCAGADHSMLSISGMVPNGVPAVFLTAPDGTAVRADVKDNAYEFLLPNQRSYQQRYVVWTGGDGTPHVQPIVTFAAVRASACRSSAKLTQSVPRVVAERPRGHVLGWLADGNRRRGSCGDGIGRARRARGARRRHRRRRRRPDGALPRRRADRDRGACEGVGRRYREAPRCSPCCAAARRSSSASTGSRRSSSRRRRRPRPPTARPAHSCSRRSSTPTSLT